MSLVLVDIPTLVAHGGRERHSWENLIAYSVQHAST
jgi:hypothetical protein